MGKDTPFYYCAKPPLLAESSFILFLFSEINALNSWLGKSSFASNTLIVLADFKQSLNTSLETCSKRSK